MRGIKFRQFEAESLNIIYPKNATATTPVLQR